jgi:uncharacterized protein (TIGR02246 family)
MPHDPPALSGFHPMPRFLIVTALIAAVLCGSASAQQSAMAPASTALEIEALIQKQTDLLMKKDAAELARLFAADAVYATASGDVYSGQEKIRQYYAKTIPALGEFTRESAPDEIHDFGANAWALGHGRTTVRTQDGVVELKDHWIAVYEKIGGEWKILALSLGENVTLLPARN